MNNLAYLIPVALFLGGASLLAFLWALKSGQYEDLDGAGERILLDEGGESDAAYSFPSFCARSKPPEVSTSSQSTPLRSREGRRG